MTNLFISLNVSLLAKILSIHFDRADFCPALYSIARRLDYVSAPEEAYNSRKSLGKVRNVMPILTEHNH